MTLGKPRAAVVGRHLYGYGGGAVAQLAIIEGLVDLGYRVDVYASMPVQPAIARRLGQNGVSIAQHYVGCTRNYDLAVNVDHFTYEPPLAKLNLAHIFHPHSGNAPNDAVRQHYRFSANSQYTAKWILNEWDITAPHLYVPVESGLTPQPKGQTILHVSRFSRPFDLADKGHVQMIQAFRAIYEAGATDWELILAGSAEDGNYIQMLQAQARGLPIRFVIDPSNSSLWELYAQASIYWHMTGASLPDVHGAQEHLGLTTIEAMIAGCVPVVLGTGGQPEIVKDGATGRLARNTNEMAQFTLQVIGDLTGWSVLAQNAMRAAQPWLDWGAWLLRLDAWIKNKPIPELPAVAWPEPQFKAADVCIVIPTRGAPTLRDSLQTLLRRTPKDVQVFVIDNCAEPLVLAEDVLARVVIIRPPQPVNFAAANALALQYTERAVLVAMNDDVLHIDDYWLDNMLATFEPGVGVVGAKLLYPDGRLQHAGGRLDWNRPDIGYHFLYGAPDCPAANQVMYVPFVTGALMAARRECWNWPAWSGWGYEDTDLCMMAALNGYAVVYQPAARALHMEGASRKESPTDTKETQANRKLFRDKWFAKAHELPWLWLSGAHYWRARQ